MGRTEDRTHVFCLVFQLPYIDISDAGTVVERYYDGLEQGKEGIDTKFVKREFEGVIENLNMIDQKINEVLTDWDLNRLAAADLAILRLAVFELVFGEKIPHKVAINEAINLAKVYSAKDAPKFINGALGSVFEKEEERRRIGTEEEKEE